MEWYAESLKRIWRDSKGKVNVSPILSNSQLYEILKKCSSLAELQGIYGAMDMLRKKGISIDEIERFILKVNITNRENQ